jgi:signal transduction histidine kinase
MERGTRLFDLRDEQGRPLPLERLPQQRIVRGETLAGAEIVETLVRPLDGRERVWSFGGAPIRDEQGGILGGVTTFRDVTERRELERRTAESLAALLEMAWALVQGVGDETQEAPEGTSILVRLLRLVQRAIGSQYTAATLVTPETGAFQPLMVMGVSPEVEARWWSDLKSGKVSDYLTPEMAERLYAGEVLTFDLAGQPPIPGQDYFELQQVLAAAVWVNPRQVCLLGVEIRNRPAFTQAEQDVAQAAVRLMALVLERDRLLGERIAAQVQSRALDSANQEMSASLSLVGHELRTPITSIRGQAQLLKRRLQRLWDSAETSGRRNDEYARARVSVEEGLDRIEGQTRRMNRLVEDLLEVARLQTTQLEVQQEPCDLSNLVEKVVAEQQLAWLERQLHLRATTEEALWVEADVERLRQVVTNYLTNALKYAPLSPHRDHPAAERAAGARRGARRGARDSPRRAGPYLGALPLRARPRGPTRRWWGTGIGPLPVQGPHRGPGRSGGRGECAGAG